MYPFITIFNKNISVYGILMFLGVALVFVLANNRMKKQNACIYDLFIVAAFCMLFVLIGSSVLYALVTYPFGTLVKMLLAGKFEVFGGLVYYGGLIGGIIGAIIGVKVSKVDTKIVERSVIPFLPLGHAIGRVGCVMAGCCNGMEYSGLFAIHYPHSVAGLPPEQGYFPVQLLEAFINIFIALILIFYSRKERKTYNILFLYLLMYGITRFSLEFLRGDAVRGIYFGISTSQWVSIGLIAISLLNFAFRYFISIRNSNKTEIKN